MAKVLPFRKRGAAGRERGGKRGPKVECHASQRWLQFPPAALEFKEGALMVVAVMTADSRGHERKICDLLLSRDDILAAAQSVTPMK